MKPKSAACRTANGSCRVFERCLCQRPRKSPRPVAPSAVAKRMSPSSRLLSRKNRVVRPQLIGAGRTFVTARSTGSTSSVSPFTATTRTRAPARNLRARVSLPELAAHPDLTDGRQRLAHFAGCADEGPDAGLHLLMPHAALPVADLEAEEHQGREPAERVPRRGQEDEERQASNRNIGDPFNDSPRHPAPASPRADDWSREFTRWG